MFIAGPGNTFVRSGRRWVYGLLPGLEITGWHLAASAWVMHNGAWKLCHRDGGVTAAEGLFIEITPPGTLDTELEFVARWSLTPPEVDADYEIPVWYHNGAPVGGSGFSTMRVPSVGGQLHVVSFDIRRRARTDGDPGGHTAPGAVVNSGDYYLYDPRDPM